MNCTCRQIRNVTLKEDIMRTKTTMTALASLLLVVTAGYAFGAPSKNEAGTGPNAVAYRACEGKTPGSSSQLISPKGEIVPGICLEENGKLVLRPERSGSESSDAHRTVPPEAYMACEGKTVGSPASLVSPRGDTVNGTCEEYSGKLVLRPDQPPQ
jgi:hypothetical protein